MAKKVRSRIRNSVTPATLSSIGWLAFICSIYITDTPKIVKLLILSVARVLP